jgi:3-hydroxybutyryl-CoA dehydrogenase
MLRLVEKGRIDTQEKDRILGNIQFGQELSLHEGADLVIEAIIENPTIKAQVLQELESLLSESAIIATNTSSLSVTQLAAGIQHPERFVGMHFFNPPALMKLVEIVPALQTHTNTTERATEIAASWGKLPVLAKDTPGFIVNKVARPFYGEALRIHDEQIADAATIDWAMKELGGFRMGPFELMDFIGNDINFTVTCTVFEAFFHDGRYRPSLTQQKLNEAGWLGRKSGRGYYDYSEGASNPEANRDAALGHQILDRVIAMLINEAADTFYMGIASVDDIETAMTKGVNYPRGLFAWADEIGIQTVVNRLDALFDRYREERYRTCPLLRDMAESGRTFQQNAEAAAH